MNTHKHMTPLPIINPAKYPTYITRLKLEKLDWWLLGKQEITAKARDQMQQTFFRQSIQLLAFLMRKLNIKCSKWTYSSQCFSIYRVMFMAITNQGNIGRPEDSKWLNSCFIRLEKLETNLIETITDLITGFSAIKRKSGQQENRNHDYASN